MVRQSLPFLTLTDLSHTMNTSKELNYAQTKIAKENKRSCATDNNPWGDFDRFSLKSRKSVGKL